MADSEGPSRICSSLHSSDGWGSHRRRRWRFREDQEFFSAEEASLEFAPTPLHLIPNFRLAICLPETL